jgi:hypothetical protein
LLRESRRPSCAPFDTKFASRRQEACPNRQMRGHRRGLAGDCGDRRYFQVILARTHPSLLSMIVTEVPLTPTLHSEKSWPIFCSAKLGDRRLSRCADRQGDNASAPALRVACRPCHMRVVYPPSAGQGPPGTADTARLRGRFPQCSSQFRGSRCVDELKLWACGPAQPVTSSKGGKSHEYASDDASGL